MHGASNEDAPNSCFLPGFPPPSEAMCRPAVGNRHSPPLPPLPDFAKFLGYTATALPSSPPPQTTHRRRRRQLTQEEAEQTTDIRHQRNSLPTQQGDSRYGISFAFLSSPRRRCFGTALRS
ncbi:hypothetical protein K525DRAFT_260377, partial [Schizophyllum commune Loenen D]